MVKRLNDGEPAGVESEKRRARAVGARRAFVAFIGRDAIRVANASAVREGEEGGIDEERGGGRSLEIEPLAHVRPLSIVRHNGWVRAQEWRQRRSLVRNEGGVSNEREIN